MGRVRKGLTYSNVMSTLAVFIVLGGGAYAAADQLGVIGKNSVGKAQIKKGAVTKDKLGTGVRKALGLRSGSGAPGQQGAQGAPGQNGQDGQDGQQGPPGNANTSLIEGLGTNFIGPGPVIFPPVVVPVESGATELTPFIEASGLNAATSFQCDGTVTASQNGENYTLTFDQVNLTPGTRAQSTASPVVVPGGAGEIASVSYVCQVSLGLNGLLTPKVTVLGL